ncbi:hypothetical protein [Polaribacter tangerinus]|uniref:hypothetical protein n=1 Tax=Polaribacter tangerinus TaxID=1920034 RepID=UPI000B4A8C7C|nr:hypothetical protein [Polaribacter tangerinus]
MNILKNNLLYTLNVFGHGENNPLLMRVLITDKYTKVDFGYVTTNKYIKGGWITISPKTYIEIPSLKDRFYLVKAAGITIAPEKHNFESKQDWRYFSLYFPPIPRSAKYIHIIEKENGSENDFNYYNVQLDKDSAIETI